MKYRELSNSYQQKAYELSVIIGKLKCLQDSCKINMEAADDNGDSYYDLMPVLEHAGVALASMVVYANEYKEEADKLEIERKIELTKKQEDLKEVTADKPDDAEMLEEDQVIYRKARAHV